MILFSFFLRQDINICFIFIYFGYALTLNFGSKAFQIRLILRLRQDPLSKDINFLKKMGLYQVQLKLFRLKTLYWLEGC